MVVLRLHLNSSLNEGIKTHYYWPAIVTQLIVFSKSYNNALVENTNGAFGVFF
jgi:hypothetical protein